MYFAQNHHTGLGIKTRFLPQTRKLFSYVEKKLLLASTNYFNYLIVFINISPIKCDFVTLGKLRLRNISSPTVQKCHELQPNLFTQAIL